MHVKRFEGKVAVVMGAGSIGTGWSNGKACAVEFARQGAAVVCVDFMNDRAEAAAEFIRGEGGRALAVQADATSEQDVERVVKEAVREFGNIDVWHNNVGVGGTTGNPEQISLEGWNKEFAQNVTSAYLGIRHVAPVMRENGGGAIINVSSLLSTRFLRQQTVAYTSSKAAVEALTRTCAIAYGKDNIRVNCIRVGFSETALVQAVLDARGLSKERAEEEMNKSRSKVPLRSEHTDPFDIARAAAFLASSDAGHITGVILNVDGGLECAPI